MMLLVLMGLLVLNGFISWWNCKAVGSVWVESRQIGGYMRVLAWCGAIQAAIGFSSVLIFVMAFSAYALGYLPANYAKAAFSLWYLLIIFPALGTGLIITINSLVVAWRERSISSMGIAAWNTFAQGLNMYNAVSDIPDAFRSVSDLFNSKDSDDRKTALVILIVVFAVAGGILITFGLIKHYASKNLPQQITV